MHQLKDLYLTGRNKLIDKKSDAIFYAPHIKVLPWFTFSEFKPLHNYER